MLRHPLDGRYRCEHLLGSGGMAEVWQGRDLRLDRPVAIKVLTGAGLGEPMAVERFDREARAAARLTHPNIVGVYDFGTDDGNPYLVMELVAGRTVAALIAGGPLPLDRAVGVAVQVCDGLIAAHAAGVVHRDIKPGNLILTPSGVVKICDFGIARLSRDLQNTLTGAAIRLGTSSYMAPEQATGGPVDARTDLYGLGCTLYALISGAPPFAGDPLGVIHQHVNDPPAPLRSRRPDVPSALDALVAELLAKDPAGRPADATQVRARLMALAGDREVTTVGVGAATAGGAGPVIPVGAVGPAGTVGPPDTAGPAGSVGPASAAGVAGAGAPGGAARLAEPGDPDATPPARRRRRGALVLAAAVLGAALVALAAVAWPDSDRPPTPAAQPTVPPAPSPTTGRPEVDALPVTAAPTTPALRTPAPAAPATPTPRARTQSPTRASTTTPAPPADPIVAMRLAIQQQVQTGQLNPDAAKDLHSKVDAIAKEIAENDPDQAREQIKKLREKLAELLTGGKLGSDGYDVLTDNVDRIAAEVA